MKLNSVRKLSIAVILVAVVTAALYVTSVAKPAYASTARGFHFMAVSGTPAGSSFSTATDLWVMDGNGRFDISTLKANGGGNFEHVLNTVDGVPTAKPKPLVAFGTWSVTGLVSYTEDGTYGAQAAGTVVFNIQLSTTAETKVSATLTVVCHAPFATFPQTSAPEGFVLVVDGTTFQPLTPVVGLTLIDLFNLT